MSENISKGMQMAITFRPFLTNPSESMKDCNLNVEAMGKSIEKLIVSEIEPYEEIITRVKQLLSALEYEKLTDYQGKVVLLLEQSMKIIQTFKGENEGD